MSGTVIVHKNRTNVVYVNVGFAVTAGTVTSEIRSEPDVDSPLLAAWVISLTTDGTDGELTLTMDNTISAQVEVDKGYMDLKHVVGGEPYSVFDQPLEVSFRGTVTA